MSHTHPVSRGRPMSEPSGRIGIVLLVEVVTTSEIVAGAPGRLDKIAAIASLLTRVPDAEVPVAVAFLSGDLTQRQIGVGYAALVDLLDPADFGTPDFATGPGPEREAEAEHDGPERDAGSEIPAASGPALTLAETDALFGRIGALLGPGSQAQRRDLLAGLLRRASGAERRFLVRLLAGDLRQGALEGVMTEAVARAAGVPAAEVRRAHQLRGSLPEVARAALAAAAGGADRADVVRVLREFTLRVGRPIRPMLAASAPNVAAALSKISPAALEWKIDGVRIQLHRDGEQVRVFTRTLDDITDRVPELVRIGLELSARTAVVDGEAVALRPDGRPYPFQVTSARIATQRATPPGAGPGPGPEPETEPGPGIGPGNRDAQVTLTAFLFDLLHADGEDLLDQPATERVRRLTAIAPPGTLVPRLVTADADEAAGFFADALAQGHEGVVVKAVDAPYRAGRRGADWIKVKPRSTLDLVILAAEWGHGRRTGLLSNLHLGARDPGTGGFVMLGKTFKGLTDAMLTWQTGELLARADPPAATPGHSPPHGVVRVRPELVAEIAFDGVQASRRYPGGVTLRFARVLRYRTDKDAADADTIGAVRALWTGGEDHAPASGELPGHSRLAGRRGRFDRPGRQVSDRGEELPGQRPGIREHGEPGKLIRPVPAERVRGLPDGPDVIGHGHEEVVDVEVRTSHVIVGVDRLLHDPPRQADDPPGRGDIRRHRGGRRRQEPDVQAGLLGHLPAGRLRGRLVGFHMTARHHHAAKQRMQDQADPPDPIHPGERERAGGRVLDSHRTILP